jgi:2-iminobutanoate/2-iminopropanoate deaminase
MKHLFIILFLIILPLYAFAQHTTGDSPDVVYLKADTASPLPFSDAVRVGNMLYLSGVAGTDSTGKVVPGGIEAEARQVLSKISAILKRNGSSLDRVIKCTVILTDIKEWPAFNAIYKNYFDRHRLPARTSFAASGLPFGAKLEMECWATID